MNAVPLRSQFALRLSSTELNALATLAGMALFIAAQAKGATATFSTAAPAVTTNDIAQLTGHYTGTGAASNRKKSNVGGPVNDDNMLYIDNGRPAQGQTFKTGSNPNGYQLTGVTLKQVTYDTYALVPDITYAIRVTLPSGNTLTVLSEENALALEDATDCTTCNFPTIDFGGTLGAGSGRYITFTFGIPVVLNPNTIYGFDVGGMSTGHYWETDGRAWTPGGGSGTAVDPYTNGTAYSTGVPPVGFPANGLGNTVITPRGGDRVFIAKLTPLGAPVGPAITVQPTSLTLYTSRTATFTAKATGSPTLSYRWYKNGISLNNGGNISGALTDSLTISNISSGDAASYTLVVTNTAASANSVTSAPAILTVITPPPGGYANAVVTNNALAYWRFNETSDPSTNPPAHEFMSGRAGTYQSVNQNGFNGIAGPRPATFPGFESTNYAAQSAESTDQSWVTVPGLNLSTNTVTFTAWIYPIGAQLDDVGIFWTRVGTVASFGYGGIATANKDQLMYCWNNASQSTWGFQSGLVIPTDQWSFVAVSIEPTRATLYLGSNGGALTNAINNVAHISEVWDGIGRIGGDPQPGNIHRTFNGIIDEVAVFKRALTFDQVNQLYGVGRGIIQPVPPSFVAQPRSQALYPGHTARFNAAAVGSAPLVYQWRKNGTNISNGGSISGASTDALTVSGISAADVGTYTLVVTNSLARATSSAVSLTLVTPSGKAYEAAVRAASPVAYWRLNETGDPATNTAAFDYWGGLAGVYRSAAQNGFNGIEGPRPAGFPEFESNNTALRSTLSTDQSWVNVPALNLNTNTVTITAWINPNIDHNSYQAIFYTRRSTTAGIQYTDDNQIGYTWNNGHQETYEFRSELRPPANQWSFVALVIQPTNAALYLYNTNGLFSTNNAIPHISEPWSDTADIGADADSGIDRTFDGTIDEVAVFNYAFTPAQVLNLYNAAFGAAPPSVTLTIQKVGANVQLSWPQGTLLEASAVTGPYTTNVASSPYVVAPTGTAKFFRVKVQ